MTIKALDLLLPIKPIPGIGYIERPGYRKIAISFSESQFHKIRERAIRENKSVSEMVSELCVVGLLDLEDSDALEPTLVPRK